MSLVVKSRLQTLQNNTLIGPAAILFISANVANVANLVFNMVFARLMGPTLFADLTLLLTLKLGVLSFLGAAQFAFAEHTAKACNADQSKRQAKALSWKSLKLSIPLMFFILVCAEYLSSILNFSSSMALRFLTLALPFFVPMVIYRGLTQGLIDVPKIVLSIQAEWIIRLLGSIIMWKVGFGLPGIAIAVALSIVVGFIFSTSHRELKSTHLAPKASESLEVKALGATAMPYLILQLAQVLVLDSDIFVAKAVLSAETAGLVAGLLLIQRVFVFAFLSCSTILQPYVAKQKEENRTPKELFTLLLAIGVITLLALSVIIPNSELVVKIMLGDAYKQLSSIIWISAITGAVFIVSHLCAIYQIAKGQKFAAKLVLAFGLFQLISLTSVNHFFPELGLYSYFSIKLAIQTLCAVCLLGVVVFTHRRALSER